MSRLNEAFDGKTFDADRDTSRLKAQLDEVRYFMFRNPGWHTLDEIHSGTGHPQASISARLRDLRKTRFGGYVILKRLRGGQRGLFEYHLDFPTAVAAPGKTIVPPSLAVVAGLVVCCIYGFFMLQPAFGRDVGQWEGSDPAIRQWYRGLMQPDNPNLSCCGEADAYWADKIEVDRATGQVFAIITDTRPDEPLGRRHIPPGTRFVVPPHKLKWDRGNPTGHTVIFISSADQVLCVVQTGGV